MSFGWRRAVGLVSFIALALATLGCGDDEPKEPEFVRFGGGSSGSESGSSVTLVPGGSAGSTSLQLFAGATSASTPTLGVTVRHSQSGSAAADEAFVVAILPFVPSGPGPFVPISAREQARIVSALEGIGIKKEDISFEQELSYGPFARVSVRVLVSDLPAQGKKIVDAIESVTGRAQSAGASFAVSDCNAALAPIRKAAFAAARQDAEALAKAASLTLGPIVAAAETPTQTYGPPSSDPCSPSPALGPKVPGQLQPFESKPEVKLTLDLTVTYALSDAAGAARLTASGTGSATAKADEAYVIVAASPQSGPFGPTPLSNRDRDDVVEGLKALGIDEEDIAIESQSFGAPTVVSVAMELRKLQQIGKEIVRAVEEVLGPSQFQGVRFGHSNCRAVLAEARKQALADAAKNAQSLAQAAGVQLGGLIALAESLTSPMPYAASLNACSEDFARLLAFSGPYAAALQSFDAEPELTVTAAVVATYVMTP